MNLDQVMNEIRSSMAKFDGSEKELYEYLMSEAEGWEMRLQELEDEE